MYVAGQYLLINISAHLTIKLYYYGQVLMAGLPIGQQEVQRQLQGYDWGGFLDKGSSSR
jgi:hypothetical protein